MTIGFDTFNYGQSYNLDGENILSHTLNGELNELKSQDECYFCFEGTIGNYVLWMNGDNEVKNNGTLINTLINKKIGFIYTDQLKNAVTNSFVEAGCTMDCIKAKESPSSSNGGGSNGGGSNGGGSNGGGSNGGGSNGGGEDFMFGMSKMTVGLVGAGALVGIYLLIS